MKKKMYLTCVSTLFSTFQLYSWLFDFIFEMSFNFILDILALFWVLTLFLMFQIKFSTLQLYSWRVSVLFLTFLLYSWCFDFILNMYFNCILLAF